MYKEQVEHYKKRMLEMKNAMAGVDIDGVVASLGFTGMDLKQELLDNTQKIQTVALNIAKKATLGRILGYGYAAAITNLADLLGVNYKLYSGFCVPSDSVRFSKELADFDKKKTADNPHPSMANHFYVMIGNNCYEYYNGRTSGIEKIDVAEVDR